MRISREELRRRTWTGAIRSLVNAALILLVGTLVIPSVLAQSDTDVVVGKKKGEVHFTRQVKAGDTVLAPGMYQVQHLQDGTDHVIVFREMSMPAGYRMGSTAVGKEVARVKCTVQAVEKKVGTTRITLRTNEAGEKQIWEVQIAGELYKHTL